MIETAREASLAEDKNSAIREKLLSYLEKSIFTDLLLEMVKRINYQEWWQILSLADDIDKTRQLIGGCRRTLESNPEFPGLYFLSGFARLLLPNQDMKLVFNDFKSGIIMLKKLFAEQLIIQSEIAVSIITEINTRFNDSYIDLYNMILDGIPSREVAKRLFQYFPEKSTLIMMNSIFNKLNDFSTNYLRGL